MSTNVVTTFKHGSRTELGEGLFWNDSAQELLWVDIFGNKIYRHLFHNQSTTEWQAPGFDPSSIHPVIDVNSTSQMIHPDHYLISLDQELGYWHTETNTFAPIYQLDGKSPDIRFNDAKCDPNGVLWIGTLDKHDRPNRASLYQMSPPHDDYSVELRTILPASLSNGLDWSLSGDRLFYIDTPKQTVQVFKYDPSLPGSNKLLGKVGEIDLQSYRGVPDGLTVGADGHLWIAMWDGSQLLRVDPETQQVVEQVALPVSRPTTCAFAGANLDTLYITTSKVESELESGYLLTANLTSNPKGLPGRAYHPKAN